MFVVDMAKVKT